LRLRAMALSFMAVGSLVQAIHSVEGSVAPAGRRPPLPHGLSELEGWQRSNGPYQPGQIPVREKPAPKPSDVEGVNRGLCPGLLGASDPAVPDDKRQADQQEWHPA
jgi:hypothetical protein